MPSRTRLNETIAAISSLDLAAMAEARAHQDRLTKPRGSLGALEDVAVRLAGIAAVSPPPLPEPAALAIFAADHGVHAQGVSPWPQEVTTQMVANFLAGGAVANAFAAQAGITVTVVDVGVATDLPPAPNLRVHKAGYGTADLSQGPAMTEAQALTALCAGIETATTLIADGARCLITGDMGIANTTASAALICAFTGSDPTDATGRGTGIDDTTLNHKIAIIRQALTKNAIPGAGHASQPPTKNEISDAGGTSQALATNAGPGIGDSSQALTEGAVTGAGGTSRALATNAGPGAGDPSQALAMNAVSGIGDSSQALAEAAVSGAGDSFQALAANEVPNVGDSSQALAENAIPGAGDLSQALRILAAVGGFEHAAIAGFVLGAAAQRVPVVLDGVIAGAAALVAAGLAPEAIGYCVAGHRSAEPGHAIALEFLGLRPLVDLELRLGEGSGGLLAQPLIVAAARVMHDVATFDSAGVSDKT
ncbi:hypothetical protein Acor_18680 [Acrocarpospora corrugata]|uniref:Nicotinate-nucleotide--dimethylbenzimidazole phosphoribosyltransferase n=1 Tax=Acrocarpospora corrugata TaxID=35763 RepID=A0A5M3VSS0_9ACTN|nr:nicotinate-nucleotide--dimethylbenzimidazole phosphoribosyltransferase [Acrocarpospora corrugata]GER99804.1 hypothetical protein Acor_18680 [Acrocarpospora corrugata]